LIRKIITRNLLNLKNTMIESSKKEKKDRIINPVEKEIDK
jgi:hypothetical protein